MTLKVVIGQRGRAWRVEVEDSVLAGKSIADKVDGKVLNSDLAGYEFQITGGTDFAGFPMTESVEGIGLKRVLLTKGWGMKDSRNGIRLRKTVRGKTVAETTAQVNMKVVKEGGKKIEEVFPDQNKKEEPVAEAPVENTAPTDGGEKKEEPKTEEVKSEEKPAENTEKSSENAA